MDARLTETQQLLVDVVRDVAADLATTSTVGLPPGPAARRWDDGAPAPAAASRGWSVLADAGLLALRLPEPTGGAGATAVEVALVAEQLGRALVLAPYFGPGVLAPALAQHAPPDVLGAMVDGSARWAVAMRPGLGGLAQLGEPALAVDAAGADRAIALEGRTPRLVPLDGGRVVDGIDLTRLVIDVPAGIAPVDDVDLGAPLDEEALVRIEALALATAAADALGVMGAALDAGVAYVKERRQFGVPVGSFQAVQHLAADAAVAVEAARSSLWYAAWAVDTLTAGEALTAARQAKAFVSEEARRVTETAIQLLGGIGMTWEELAHVRLRRAQLDRVLFGDEHAQCRLLVDHRLGGVAAAGGEVPDGLA